MFPWESGIVFLLFHDQLYLKELAKRYDLGSTTHHDLSHHQSHNSLCAGLISMLSQPGSSRSGRGGVGGAVDSEAESTGQWVESRPGWASRWGTSTRCLVLKSWRRARTWRDRRMRKGRLHCSPVFLPKSGRPPLNSREVFCPLVALLTLAC